jgi:hypothetical protein
VVNQSTAADLNFPGGNQLHVLSVAANGTVSEQAGSPVLLSPFGVPGTARVQGVAVVAGRAADHGPQTTRSPFATGRRTDHAQDLEGLLQ